MPSGDGTGPAGLGPMTGRAAGYCAGYPVPGYMNPAPAYRSWMDPIPGRGWFGYGGGWGRGWGRGFGWHGGFDPGAYYQGYGYSGYDYGYPSYGVPYYDNPYFGYPYSPEMTHQQEAEVLKEQAKAMQEDINSINKRIKELESAAKSKKK